MGSGLIYICLQASNGRTVPRSSVVPPRPRAPRRARTKCNQSTTESGVGAEEGGWKWRRAFRAFRLQQLPQQQKLKMDMVYADAATLGGSSLIVDNREKNTQLLLLRTTTLTAGYDIFYLFF